MLPEDRSRRDRPRARKNSPISGSGCLGRSERRGLRFGERLVDGIGRLFDFRRRGADHRVGGFFHRTGCGPDIPGRAADGRARLALCGPDSLACRTCSLAGCPACRALCCADHAPHLAARFRPCDLLLHRDFPTGDLDLPACRTALALRRAASRGLPCLLSCCHGTTPENADADGRRRMRHPGFTLGSRRKTVNARNGRNGGAEGDQPSTSALRTQRSPS